jgi:MoxR-like ATPase
MSTPLEPQAAAALAEAILFEVKRVVVGQDRFLQRVLVALLAQGHLLVEGVPGLAKTLTVNTLARAIQGSFKRIQFTPDLVPADLVGTRIYNQKSGEFSTSLGPVFANLLLADEINRAPAKVQSALLEVMQERQVTIAGEAQVDRFMMKVMVGYPSAEEEFVIAQRAIAPPVDVKAVASLEALTQLQAACRQVYVDPAIIQYAVRLVTATRDPASVGAPELAQRLSYGASPRATIALVEGARALGLLQGRRHARPEDVTELAADVLRHRLVLSFEALGEGQTADDVIRLLLAKVPVPDMPALAPQYQ